MIRLYLDEDVHTFIAQALRLRGWEALTTAEAGMRGATDTEQIEYARNQGWTLLTYNIGDFARLHYEQMARGQGHCGILLARQGNPRRVLRALFHLAREVSVEELRGQLVYLSQWS